MWLDQATVFAGLQSPNHHTRSKAVEEVRTNFVQNGGQLQVRSPHQLFALLAETLGDMNWNVRRDAISLVIDFLPSCCRDQNTDQHVVALLAALVPNLADTKVAIRKSTVTALQLFFKFSRKSRDMVDKIIDHGLETTDARVRAETLQYLTMPLTWEMVQPPDVARLVESTVGRLRDMDDNVVTAACRVLSTLPKVIGQVAFESHINQLPHALRQLYAQFSEPQSQGPPSSANLTSKHVAAEGDVVFGVIPGNIMGPLQDLSDWQARTQAMDQMLASVTCLEHPGAIMPHLGDLIQFLTSMFADPNLKVTITALECLGKVIDLVGWPIHSFVEQLLNGLVPLLGDNKIVVRQADTKLINKLMQALMPATVLNLLLEFLGSDNWRVREEVINVIILALSTFPKQQFDFDQLSTRLSHSLRDPKSRVKYVAVEAFAVLNKVLGADHLQALILNLQLSPELNRTLDARFAAQQLPSVNQDGLVEHIVPGSAASSSTAMSMRSDQLFEHVDSPKRPSALPWEKERKPSDNRLGSGISISSVHTEADQAKPGSPRVAASLTPGSRTAKPSGGSYAELFQAKLGRSSAGRRSASSSQATRQTQDSAHQSQASLSAGYRPSFGSRGAPELNRASRMERQRESFSLSWPGNRGGVDGAEGSPTPEPHDVPATDSPFPTKARLARPSSHKRTTDSSQRSRLGSNDNGNGRPLRRTPSDDSDRGVSPVPATHGYSARHSSQKRGGGPKTAAPFPVRATTPAAKQSATLRRTRTPAQAAATPRSRSAIPLPESESDDEPPPLRPLSMSQPIQGTTLARTPPPLKQQDSIDEEVEPAESHGRDFVGDDDDDDDDDGPPPLALRRTMPASQPLQLSPLPLSPPPLSSDLHTNGHHQDMSPPGSDLEDRSPSPGEPPSPLEDRPVALEEPTTPTVTVLQEPSVSDRGHSNTETEINPASNNTHLSPEQPANLPPESPFSSKPMLPRTPPSARRQASPALAPETESEPEVHRERPAQSSRQSASSRRSVAKSGGGSRVTARSPSPSRRSTTRSSGTSRDIMTRSPSPARRGAGSSVRTRSPSPSRPKSRQTKLAADVAAREQPQSLSPETTEDIQRPKSRSIRPAQQPQSLSPETTEDIQRPKSRSIRPAANDVFSTTEDPEADAWPSSGSAPSPKVTTERPRQLSRATQSRLKRLQSSSSAGGSTSPTPDDTFGDDQVRTPVKSRPPRAPSSGRRKGGRASATPASEKSKRGAPSLTGKNGDQYMVDIEQLGACTQSVEKTLAMAYSCLEKGQDQSTWFEKCEGIELFRKLALHHASALTPATLKGVIQALIKEVANLRSSVSRLAIRTIGDFCNLLQRSMEPELSKMVAALITKAAGEASTFIREDVEKSLGAIVDNVSASKGIAALHAQTTHKNGVGRQLALVFLAESVERVGGRLFHMRECDGVITAAATLVRDNSPVTRYHARRIFYCLMSFDEFDRVLKRTVTGGALRTAEQAIDTLRAKGLGTAPGEGAEVARATIGRKKSRRTPTKSRPGSTVPPMLSNSGQDLVQDIVTSLSSSDWRKRDEAIVSMQQLAESRGHDLGSHSDVLYAFVPRLTDQNSKVNIRAVQALNVMLPLLNQAWATVCSELVPALSSNLASKNTAVRTASLQGLGLLIQQVPAPVVVPPLCSALRGGNIVVKEALMIELARTTPSMGCSHPKLLAKYLVPVVADMLKDLPGPLRHACSGLCRAMCDTLGDGILAKLNPTIAERFRQAAAR